MFTVYANKSYKMLTDVAFDLAVHFLIPHCAKISKQIFMHAACRTILCESSLVLFFLFNPKVPPCNVFPILTLQHAIDQMWENAEIIKISSQYFNCKIQFVV